MRRDAPTIEGSAEDVTPPDAAAAAPVEGSDIFPAGLVSEPMAEEVVRPASSSEAEAAPSDPAGPFERASAFAEAEPTGAPPPNAAYGSAEKADRNRSNFATAIAIAVVVMAGAIIYLFYQLSFVGPDMSGEIAGLNSRLAALEARPVPDTGALTKQAAAAQQAAAQAESGVAALSKRVDGLAAPQPAQPTLPPQVADLPGSVADLRKSLAALQATVAALPRPDIARIDGRLGDLDQRVSALQGAVSGIPRVDLGPLTGKVDALEARLKPLEAEVQAAQSPQRVAERKAAPVAVTAQAIVDAIAAGQAFPQEFRALQVLGADPAKLAPLQTVAANGAPSLHELQDDLAQARDRIVGQGTPAPSGSYMDRIMAGATNLVQVRPLGSVVGDEPAAIVARMNVEIGADDLGAALADWQKLPEASRAASKGLAERLKLRLDAETAARDIATNAIGALAAPRG